MMILKLSKHFNVLPRSLSTLSRQVKFPPYSPNFFYACTGIILGLTSFECWDFYKTGDEVRTLTRKAKNGVPVFGEFQTIQAFTQLIDNANSSFSRVSNVPRILPEGGLEAIRNGWKSSNAQVSSLSSELCASLSSSAKVAKFMAGDANMTLALYEVLFATVEDSFCHECGTPANPEQLIYLAQVLENLSPYLIIQTDEAILLKRAWIMW